MKRIFTSPNLTHCDMVHCVLEASGIPSMLRNELASIWAGASAIGSPSFAWPEVWVNDEDVQAAEDCMKESAVSFITQATGETTSHPASTADPEPGPGADSPARQD